VSQDDKYTYPNSGGVLRNKLGLTDGARLDDAMNDFASAAWAVLSMEGTPAAFDFRYLQHVHIAMFGRIFEWAGKVRDVDTVAGNTGIVYARPQFIDDNLTDMFRELANDESLFSTEDPVEFSMKLSAHWGYLSQIHPFRDGNTRSQSLFVSNLARAAGHPLDWRRIDVEALRNARLSAIQGSERVLASVLLNSITGADNGERLIVPLLRADNSSSSGVAAPTLALQGRCGKPRQNGRGPCLRKVGEHGCPYHG